MEQDIPAKAESLPTAETSISPSTPVNPKNSKVLLIVILLLVLVVFVGLIGYLKSEVIRLTKISEPTPTPIPTISPPQDQTANWKTYSNINLGITLKYPDFYTPVETLTDQKFGEPTFVVTGKPNINSTQLILCKTNTEPLCLIPGINWSQGRDIQPTSLDGISAISFFILKQNIDGNSKVIHVIQTTKSPIVEIALSVDGMGGEETFQQIRNSFKFTPQTDETAKWKLYQGNGFSVRYPNDLIEKDLSNGVVSFIDSQGQQKFNLNGFTKLSPAEYQTYIQSKGSNFIDVKSYSDLQGRLWITDMALGEVFNFTGITHLQNAYYIVDLQSGYTVDGDGWVFRDFANQILSTLQIDK